MIKTIIYEPMTTITDLIIAFIAFYYSRELTSIYINQLLNVQYYWIWTFRMLAFGALLGALSHGIGPYCSETIANLIWKFTTFSIGVYFELKKSILASARGLSTMAQAPQARAG